MNQKSSLRADRGDFLPIDTGMSFAVFLDPVGLLASAFHRLRRPALVCKGLEGSNCNPLENKHMGR